MKHILLFFYLLIFAQIYAKDESVISVIKDDFLNDTTFTYFTSYTDKIYVWDEITQGGLAFREYERKKIRKDCYIKEKLGCDICDTITIKNTNYKFNYKELKKEKDKDKKWCHMCSYRSLDKKTTIIIKLSNIYQCQNSLSYCIIQVFLFFKCYEYEYVLKKEDNRWKIIKKNILSDYLL